MSNQVPQQAAAHAPHHRTMPPHQGCQSRLVTTAEVVHQQLPIGQPRPLAQKHRPAQVLENLAHLAVRHGVSLVQATLALYGTITRTGSFDAFFGCAPGANQSLQQKGPARRRFVPWRLSSCLTDGKLEYGCDTEQVPPSLRRTGADEGAMKQQFLARLRENPSDRTTWLVYADWLDEHDDPTGPFIRLSLDLTDGRISTEEAEARITEFERLYAAADPQTRHQLAAYRSSLPVRFRVLGRDHIGEDPPREMFGYARTVAIGFLETGRIKPGMNLGVGAHADGRPRRLQTIWVFASTVDEMVAGRQPIQAGLGWLGHLNIEVGSVLTVVDNGKP
jgi:uncharacterized protein (TIGR02996 family)